MEEESFFAIALTNIPGIGIIGANNLIKTLGSAKEIFNNKDELTSYIPGLSKRIIEALNSKEPFKRAEEEINFAEKNNIKCLTILSEEYPSRLRECDDAPITLFYKGNANLNSSHAISIVGTRHATDYGIEICKKIIGDLSQLLPDTLIISGLAYGIDINAHRQAIINKLHTVGVLAHGLDRIYPYRHRTTAAEMINNGGIITEYMSGTHPDRQNFIKRNRIIAGMADATIVIESASKGGALITADIANNYNRDCFAIPGRATDEYSAGCNNLISNNKATLITSADKLLQMLNWKNCKSKIKNIQREFFPVLNSEEQSIVNILKESDDGKQINTLVVRSNIPINKIAGILFELEMKGVIKVMAGGIYKLIK